MAAAVVPNIDLMDMVFSGRKRGLQKEGTGGP
jgi:hypothetical protein